MNRDLPGGPVVKNSPSNGGDTGLIPGQGTKISHAAGQVSLCASTTELICSGAHKPACVNEDPACHNYNLTQPKTNKQVSKHQSMTHIFLTRQILNLPCGKQSACNEVDPGIKPEGPPKRGKWQPTPLFLPGKSHGQRRQSMGLYRVGHNPT